MLIWNDVKRLQRRKISEFLTGQALTQHVQLIKAAIFERHRPRTRHVALVYCHFQAQQIAQMCFNRPDIRVNRLHDRAVRFGRTIPLNQRLGCADRKSLLNLSSMTRSRIAGGRSSSRIILATWLRDLCTRSASAAALWPNSSVSFL